MHRRDTIKMYQIFKVYATAVRSWRKSPSFFSFLGTIKWGKESALRAHCHYAFYIGFICVPHFFVRRALVSV